jgi:hypothetical protein
MNKGARIVLVNFVIALWLAACSASPRTAVSSTPVDPETPDTPTVVTTIGATVPATPTLTPANTSTSTATAPPLPTDAPLSPVPTETPQSPIPTETPSLPATAPPPPSPTSTAIPIQVPAPQLVSPVYGEYKNPFVFKWNGPPTVSYQVTLRHRDSGITHTSGYIAGLEWKFDIPAEQFGNWEWYITNSNGSRSETYTFVFNPNAGSGGGSSSTTELSPSPTDTPDVPPPVTRSAPGH